MILLGLFPAPVHAQEASISGSVFYRERMALPNNAVLTVNLMETGMHDAPPIATTRVEPTGQVPIAFTLKVPETQLSEGRMLGLVAQISVQGTVWFANPDPTPIDRSKPGAPISILMHRVAEQPDPSAAAPDGVKAIQWRLVKLGGKDAAPDVDTNLTFHEDGTVSGSGGCNRIGGGAKFTGQKVKFGKFFGTMMACDEAKTRQESAFLEILPSVEAYALDGDTLILLDAGGAAVAQFKATP
ncbi:META domain-containing protein [Ferirhizobium litorale]|nr:META domain-containing protein [Fererhizobium litorale]